MAVPDIEMPDVERHEIYSDHGRSSLVQNCW
jgi:hypothetical protein